MDKMSRDRHRGVLPTTCCFAVYMFLLIHHGDSTTPRHFNKTGCVSGFYGSDCRRSCRGNCLNGRCALLANGRSVNCTEGCVLGWRGLTCSTRCKRPCLECDRYTGDCVGQCRDGFCGAGCLQRCPYQFSTCDKSCVTPRKPKMTDALRETHGSNKEGLDVNPCTEKFGNNCYNCNQCSECLTGYYGSKCEEKCTENCQFDCDIQTGLCRACKDGFYGDNCSVPCSTTCYRKPCNISTGACDDGCGKGSCSPNTGCDKTCNANCPNNCHFETCSCLPSSSPETTSATPSSPKQGGILAVYWICFIVNTMHLVIVIIFIVYGYEKKWWTSLNCFCQKKPGSESSEPDQGNLMQMSGKCKGTPDQTPGDSVTEDEANTVSRTSKKSCCNPVQSIGRKARGLALALVCGYVLMNIIVCVILYYNI
ncbi:multiple epidermal growth factor-like domains protein 11 isoform X2 [Haliotis rubra]|uniref:multiple epidermal growth factor-like domains protein 11 isoform X2 n=1 Tax=Haliotis rubra TaxID=36100 RepID=UPI001EE548CC|nr:multiple epidermal growth factor-like domains protein 11 isoform X2 [Haliotis rubra]